MKNCTLLFFFLFSINLSAFSQAPTVPASNMTFNSLDGGSFRVNWINGNGTRRIVIARQGSAVTATPVNGVDYNHSNVFGSGDAIQPGQFVVADGGTSFVDLNALQAATTYHFAVYEYNGTGASTMYIATAATGSQATLSAPTDQAENVLFSNVTGNSMRLDWTNGNGQRRLVIARAGSAVNANPTDLTAYSGIALFGIGTQIGSGNYAVLASSTSNVTVTGLQPNTAYHYAVFEYNGITNPVYLIPGATASMTTAPRPTIAASNLTFNSIEGDAMRVNWTSGNGARRIVIGRAGSAVTAVPVDGVDYNHSVAFGSGDDLGSNQFVLYDGVGGLVDISNLEANTVYHFRVYEYDGTGTNTAFLTSSFASGSQPTLAAPTVQASNISFSNLSGSGVTINWSVGNGGRRIVLVRQGAAVNSDPVNYTSYSGNSTFGVGTPLGMGNYIVYASTGSSVNITNLSPNTAYHVAIFEYNGVGGPVYLTPGAVANVTTSAQPTIPASAMTFNSLEGGSMRVNWTIGNGVRRIVVARAGAAVTALPVDGVDYAANSNFTLGEAISPGQIVVYDAASSFVDVNGLQPATTYHFAVFEYNGSGVTTAYLTSTFPAASQATLSAPVTQASNINFTNVAGSSLTVNWTIGNGSRRIVVVRQGSAVNSDPVNLMAYSPSTSFGNGSQIGTGNYVVAVHTNGAPSTTITNLTANTTYHFSIYEANGASGPVYLIPGHSGSITTTPQPTVASSNMTFNSLEGNSMRVNWTSGNGSRRIVIARAGAAVTAVPVNGTDYVHSNVFGSGDAIAAGQFVIFDGVTTFVDVSALSHSTTYHFAIFEYDGTGSNASYLTSSSLAGSQATLSAPTIQTSNLTYTSVGATSMTVNWTIGNGARRIIIARQGSPVTADPVNLTYYSGVATFGSGTQIGTGNYVVYNNTTSNFNLINLVSGTTYHFAAYEFNGVSGPVYLTPAFTGSATTVGAPQTQASNASPGSVSATTIQINWTNGSGNRRLVLMKQGSAVDASPVDNSAYTANSFFGSGSQLGSGNYVVYDATGSSVTVTNLLSNTTYHFAVFEYNSFGATSQYLLVNPARGDATTLTVLPVHLLSFTAANTHNRIRLEWSTAQEQNSSHFEVQRSVDGLTFLAIGTVSARGNSATRAEYRFFDDHPLAGTMYYRLLQVDLDGSFSYSRIVSARYEPAGLVKRVVNPVTSHLSVELHTAITEPAEWRLVDIRGVVVRREVFSGHTISSDVSGIQKGIYVFELISGTMVERIKILKLE